MRLGFFLLVQTLLVKMTQEHYFCFRENDPGKTIWKPTSDLNLALLCFDIENKKTARWGMQTFCLFFLIPEDQIDFAQSIPLNLFVVVGHYLIRATYSHRNATNAFHRQGRSSQLTKWNVSDTRQLVLGTRKTSKQSQTTFRSKAEKTKVGSSQVTFLSAVLHNKRP